MFHVMRIMMPYEASYALLAGRYFGEMSKVDILLIQNLYYNFHVF